VSVKGEEVRPLGVAATSPRVAVQKYG